MRRGAVLPGLILLAIGVLIVRLRHARASNAPAPVTAPAPVPALHAVTVDEPPVTHAAPRFLSIPWQLVSPPSDDAELEIAFSRNEHEELDRVDVQETPTQVFVTVIVHWRLHAAGS